MTSERTRAGWPSRWLQAVLERGLPPRAADPAARVPGALQRILVVRNDNIGDVLCTTPALRALRRELPSAHLAVLVPAHCRAVLVGNGDVDEVLTYTKAKHGPKAARLRGLPAGLGLLRMLRARRFDLAVTMRRGFSRSSAWLTYASGAPWRLGYAAPAADPFGFFLNLPCEPAREPRHEVDSCLALLASVGVPPAGRSLHLAPEPGALAAVRTRLAAQGGAREPLALIHLSNRREGSRWPLQAFARAADRLRERLGLRGLLSWAPGDQRNPLFPGDDGKAEQVAAQMRTRPLLLATPALSELIAAISLSSFVLSTDGGPMHIAAALGIPQVVVFGRTDPRVWAPVSQQAIVLQRGGRADQVTAEEVIEAAIAVVGRDALGAPSQRH